METVRIIEPIENEQLRVEKIDRIFLKDGVYLVNSNSVIYQEEGFQKEIFPDMATFSLDENYGNVFAKDKNGIYYRGEFLQMDTGGFEVLGEFDRKGDQAGNYRGEDFIWKNKDFVFFKTQKLEVSDPHSFHFNGYDFYDKNCSYYIDFSEDKRIFEKICGENFDPSVVYWKGKKLFYKGEIVQKVNAVLMKTSKYVLVWSNGFEEHLSEVENIDNQSLTGLSEYYAKDKNRAYYQTNIVPIPTERLPFVKVFDQVNSQYITDGEVIYQNDSILRKGLDAKTFGMFPKSDFYFDKNGIYDREYDKRSNEIVNRKFPFTYKSPVSAKNSFYADGYLVYENQAVYPSWGEKDKYFKDLTAEQIDLLRKEKISLENIDNKAISVEVLDYNLYKAEGKIYWNGKPTSVDANTFERVGNFFKDKNNVYVYSRYDGLKIVQGIDNQQIKVTGNGFYDDGKYLYYRIHKIIKSNDWQLLAIYGGYRMGCGEDPQPASNFYLFKNEEGYFLVEISDIVQYRFLGKTLPEKEFE